LEPQPQPALVPKPFVASRRPRRLLLGAPLLLCRRCLRRRAEPRTRSPPSQASVGRVDHPERMAALGGLEQLPQSRVLVLQPLDLQLISRVPRAHLELEPRDLAAEKVHLHIGRRRPGRVSRRRLRLGAGLVSASAAAAFGAGARGRIEVALVRPVAVWLRLQA